MQFTDASVAVTVRSSSQAQWGDFHHDDAGEFEGRIAPLFDIRCRAVTSLTPTESGRLSRTAYLSSSLVSESESESDPGPCHGDLDLATRVQVSLVPSYSSRHVTVSRFSCGEKENLKVDSEDNGHGTTERRPGRPECQRRDLPPLSRYRDWSP
jgi:hypothetical protein